MSALPVPTRASSFRTGWSLLRNCGERSLRRLIAGTFVLFASLAVVFAWRVLAIKQPVAFAFALFCIPLMLTWALWVPRGVVALRALRDLGIPAPARNAVWAVLLAYVLTVLLPMLGFTALGMAWMRALTLLSLLAAAAMFAALLPNMLVSLLCFMPLLLSNVLPKNWIEALVATLTDTPSLIWVVTLALAMGTALLSRRLLQRNMEASNRWSDPFIVRMAVGLGAGGQQVHTGGLHNWSMTQQVRTMPEWMVGIGKVAGYGVAWGRPVQALRAWLGAPYTPMDAAHYVRKSVLGIGLLLVFPLVMAMTVGARKPVDAFVMGLGWTAMMVLFGYVASYAAALLQKGRQQAGEYAELSLLPGLGDARENLLRAVLIPWARASLLVLLLIGMLPVLLIDETVISLRWALLPVVVSILHSGMLCLRALAGQPISPIWWWISCLIGMPLVSVSGFALMPKLRDFMPEWLVGVATPAWTAIGIFSLVIATVAWRAYWRRPHPFLQE